MQRAARLPAYRMIAVHGRCVVGRNAIGAMPFGYCALRRQQGLRFRPIEKRVGVQKSARRCLCCNGGEGAHGLGRRAGRLGVGRGAAGRCLITGFLLDTSFLITLADDSAVSAHPSIILIEDSRA